MVLLTNLNMVIEYLRIHVTAESRERFVQLDEAIWTTALAQYAGFLGKEVWINPDHQEEVVIIVHWESLDAWDAIPADTLNRVEEEFKAAMGETYAIVESSRYQVRKFMRRSTDA